MEVIESDPPTLTVGDVCRLTGLGRSSVQKLADAGVLRCFRVPMPGSKHVERRFRRAWVDEFLAEHTTAAAK